MGCLLKGGGGLYQRLVVGAVLLAAGSGSRLGGRPKSLLQLGGVPLIRRQIIALSGAGVDELVVVLGHHADKIEAAVSDFPLTLARNPSPDDGQPSSVRIGLQALSGKLDAVIIALADQPMINSQDVTALIAAFKAREPGQQMVVPRVAGQPGNPVIIDAALREEWLSGETDAVGGQWRVDFPDSVRWMDTDNRRYRVDIDTEADIQAFAQRTGHQLNWPVELVAG